MKLSEVSIRRPVLATVMSLAIVLFGVLALDRLPVREYPDVDPPIVSVVTLYRGANPSVVETEITDPIEEQLATLEGVKSISSSSKEGGSVVTVEFELQRDVAEASNDVRDRISRIRGNLPRAAEDPVVEKVDTNAQPIYWLALSSDRHSPLELTEVAELTLKERLQKLPGVGSVFIGGERRYAMRVWLDSDRMAAHGLTTIEIEEAIRRENAEIPGGRIEGSERELAVRTRGELATPEEFSAIVVAKAGDHTVRLGDVARVEIGPEDERTIARYNGHPAVGLGVVKQSRASTLEVAAGVSAALPDLRALLQPGMALETAYDSSIFIRESLDEVRDTLLLSVLLVVLVTLAFLKSFRATLLPALAIPVSIVGAFTAAWVFGFTVNILTLLALVLAIGLVVDDAIVMMENIYRHMEMGKSRLRAAFDGAREIAFAVVATTVSLVAVFLPVAFLTGNIGKLFNEFGLSLAVAVAISGFVALTLTPMLASKLLRPLFGAGAGRVSRSFDAFFSGLDRLYSATLRAALRHRALVLAVTLVVVGGSAWLFRMLPRELVPSEDRGYAFGIVIAPEGATLGYTDRYMRELERVLLALPERAGLFTATGLGFNGPGQVTNGFLFLNFKPRNERTRSAQEIVQALFPQTFAIPGVLAFVVNPPSLGGEFSAQPVQYVLQASSYEELGAAVGTLMARAQASGLFVNLDTDLRLDKPQLDVAIDRERAAGLGVSVTDIGSALEILLGGRVTSEFKRGSKQYDVIVQLDAGDRATPDAIEGVYLRGREGLVRLSNLVSVRDTVGAKELNHWNRQRSATLTANLAPGVSLGQALDALDGWRSELGPAVRHDWKGQSREFRESTSKLYLMFVLAVVFIYLVLAAQFESFVHPLTILLSVPLAMAGAIASLFALGQSLNIYSEIGLVMLVGLVTKNAILIVEYANQLRERGRDLLAAVHEASRIRLRPILMTSFSTIFGVLPIALGLGAGAESRRPLGIAVVGGMLFSTFLTLVVVPVVWSLFARFTRARRTVEIELESEELATAGSAAAAGGARG